MCQALCQVPYSSHFVWASWRSYGDLHFTVTHLRLWKVKELVQGHSEKVKKDQNSGLLTSWALVPKPLSVCLPEYSIGKFWEIINSNPLVLHLKKGGSLIYSRSPSYCACRNRTKTWYTAPISCLTFQEEMKPYSIAIKMYWSVFYQFDLVFWALSLLYKCNLLKTSIQILRKEGHTHTSRNCLPCHFSCFFLTANQAQSQRCLSLAWWQSSLTGPRWKGTVSCSAWLYHTMIKSSEYSMGTQKAKRKSLALQMPQWT